MKLGLTLNISKEYKFGPLRALTWVDKILRLENSSGLAQTQLCLWHRDSCVCGKETAVSVAQRQGCLWHKESCLYCTETAVSAAQRQIVSVAQRSLWFLQRQMQQNHELWHETGLDASV